MIKVISDDEVTLYSSDHYSVQYMQCGTGRLSCNQSGRTVAHIVPLRLDHDGRKTIEVFTEEHNFIKDKKKGQ